MARRGSSKRPRGKNKRKPARRAHTRARRAGAGGGALHARSRAEFESFLGEDQIVVVDFWAPWCGPCKAMAPAFDRVASQFEGRARFVKVNTEQVPEVAEAFGIRSIPTLIVMRGTRVVDSHVGLTDESRLARMTERAIDRSQGRSWTDRLRRVLSRDGDAPADQPGG